MAIVSVTKKPNSETFSPEGSTRRYGEVWTVRTDDPKESAETVERAEGLPRLGRSLNGRYPWESSHGKKLEETTDGALWEVTVNYSNKAPTGGNKEGGGGPDDSPNEDPLKRHAKWSWRSGVIDTFPQKDLDGRPIVNSAGEPFHEGVAVPESYTILQITRNLDEFPVEAADYVQSINERAFLDFGPMTGKFASLAGDTEIENGKAYWRVIYEFHFRSLRQDGTSPWFVDKLNEGNYYLDLQSDDLKAQIVYPRDKNNIAALRAVPLDEWGQKLSDANRAAGNFTYSTFRVLWTQDWKKFLDVEAL